MITMVIVVILFSFFVVYINLSDPLSKHYAYIENAIAGTLRKVNTEIEKPIRIRNNLTIEIDGLSYKLTGDRFKLISPAGDSMSRAGLSLGDISIFDTKKELRQVQIGKIIAIRLNDEHGENFGKIKLRLFYGMTNDETGKQRIIVKQYSKKGQIVDCNFTHPIENYIGAEVARFDSEFKDRLVSQMCV